MTRTHIQIRVWPVARGLIAMRISKLIIKANVRIRRMPLPVQQYTSPCAIAKAKLIPIYVNCNEIRALTGSIRMERAANRSRNELKILCIYCPIVTVCDSTANRNRFYRFCHSRIENKYFFWIESKRWSQLFWFDQHLNQRWRESDRQIRVKYRTMEMFQLNQTSKPKTAVWILLFWVWKNTKFYRSVLPIESNAKHRFHYKKAEAIERAVWVEFHRIEESCISSLEWFVWRSLPFRQCITIKTILALNQLSPPAYPPPPPDDHHRAADARENIDLFAVRIIELIQLAVWLAVRSILDCKFITMDHVRQTTRTLLRVFKLSILYVAAIMWRIRIRATMDSVHVMMANILKELAAALKLQRYVDNREFVDFDILCI